MQRKEISPMRPSMAARAVPHEKRLGAVASARQFGWPAITSTSAGAASFAARALDHYSTATVANPNPAPPAADAGVVASISYCNRAHATRGDGRRHHRARPADRHPRPSPATHHYSLLAPPPPPPSQTEVNRLHQGSRHRLHHLRNQLSLARSRIPTDSPPTVWS